MTNTYLTCLTPAGRGAIATLALRGPNAWTLVRQFMSSKHLPESPEPHRIVLGKLGDKARGMDDVVVCARSQDYVELHCHGGAEVVRMIRELFQTQGAVFCSWQEFEAAASADGLAVKARIALADALTPRTAGILLDQMHGALSRALREIEAAIQAEQAEVAAARLDELLQYADLGTHLTSPWRVAIAGAPNVGKSTLINAIAGFQRSIVSPIPGTTRDVVTTSIAIDGWPVELIDTAGWRSAPDELEAEGIERGMRAAREADLCLWVVEASQSPVWHDALSNCLRVLNKIDLPAAWEAGSQVDVLRVSAKTGQGMDELLTSISRSLVPTPPPPGAAVPFEESIIAALRAARERIAARETEAAVEFLRTIMQRERETASL